MVNPICQRSSCGKTSREVFFIGVIQSQPCKQGWRWIKVFPYVCCFVSNYIQRFLSNDRQVLAQWIIKSCVQKTFLWIKFTGNNELLRNKNTGNYDFLLKKFAGKKKFLYLCSEFYREPLCSRKITHQRFSKIESMERVFKRKIYQQLLDWKQNENGRTAILVEGARRVGKSTIVELFAKQ